MCKPNISFHNVVKRTETENPSDCRFAPNNGGWELPSGAQNSVSVPFDFAAGRLLTFVFYLKPLWLFVARLTTLEPTGQMTLRFMMRSTNIARFQARTGNTGFVILDSDF